MAKLEGNSLKFTTLPPRNRCFSLLINKAACIPLIHLPVLLIVKISTVLLLLLSLLSTFFIHRLQLKFFPYPFLNQKKNKRTTQVSSQRSSNCGWYQTLQLTPNISQSASGIRWCLYPLVGTSRDMLFTKNYNWWITSWRTWRVARGCVCYRGGFTYATRQPIDGVFPNYK